MQPLLTTHQNVRYQMEGICSILQRNSCWSILRFLSGKSLVFYGFLLLHFNFKNYFFFLLFQDGILDVIFVKQQANGTSRPVAFRNTLDYDANFVKVMVLTGLTNKLTPSKKTTLGRKQRTYGSNFPGPRIAYRTTRPDGVIQASTSAQIPQSGYFALQVSIHSHSISLILLWFLKTIETVGFFLSIFFLVAIHRFGFGSNGEFCRFSNGWPVGTKSYVINTKQ